MTLYEKSVSNIKEVKARDGIVISIVTNGDNMAREASDHVIELPPAPDLLSPMLEIVPLQLLAYHIAVRRGCDVDQPQKSGEVRHCRIAERALRANYLPGQVKEF